MLIAACVVFVVGALLFMWGLLICACNLIATIIPGIRCAADSVDRLADAVLASASILLAVAFTMAGVYPMAAVPAFFVVPLILRWVASARRGKHCDAVVYTRQQHAQPVDTVEGSTS